MLGDHLMYDKVVFYEGAINVPCLIRPAGQGPGWQSSAMVEHVDVAASLVEIAGAKPLTGSPGRSLIPKVRAGPTQADADRGKDAVFSEVLGYSMVRTERHKLAVKAGTLQPVELYDLVNDPNELRNLIDEASYERVRHELLEKHLAPLIGQMDRSRLPSSFPHLGIV